MRFELIDRILDRTEDSLTGIKAVSAAEEYLADHFPGFPVLPGVMMLEALVQAARLLVAGEKGPTNPPLILSQVKNVRYGNMVRPGQALEISVNLRKRDGEGYEFQGEGKVAGQVAVQGRFRLDPLPSES